MNLMSSIDTEELPVAALDNDELWFKDAIIYQLHVKAFADSNNCLLYTSPSPRD